MSFKELKIFYFLVSADIKVFGRTYVPVCNAASDWPRTLLCPRCFCLACHYFLATIHRKLTNNLATYVHSQNVTATYIYICTLPQCYTSASKNSFS